MPTGALMTDHDRSTYPIEAFVCHEGEYKQGQVLGDVPEDAVPIDEFFKPKTQPEGKQ